MSSLRQFPPVRNPTAVGRATGDSKKEILLENHPVPNAARLRWTRPAIAFPELQKNVRLLRPNQAIPAMDQLVQNSPRPSPRQKS